MGWNPSAESYKHRMLRLKIAVQDPETKKIYLAGDQYDTHHNLFDRMNDERYLLGLPVHDVPYDITFDRWVGRGYIRKDTGEFMQAEKASEWASRWNIEQKWNGESIRLRSYQNDIKAGF